MQRYIYEKKEHIQQSVIQERKTQKYIKMREIESEMWKNSEKWGDFLMYMRRHERDREWMIVIVTHINDGEDIQKEDIEQNIYTWIKREEGRMKCEEWCVCVCESACELHSKIFL